MATLATICNRFLAPRGIEETAAYHVTAARHTAPFRLRAMPNEDVYFFRKQIDNSRVVREADPQARTVCWGSMGIAAAIVVMLIGLLAPQTMGMIDGYQIQSLRQEREKLESERAALVLEESRLLSPERLEELAKLQQFIDPAPERLVYLGPKADAVAMNATVGSR